MHESNHAAASPIHAILILAPLEVDVAGLARIGAGYCAIASLLHLSPNTVKTILQRIGDKLGPDWRDNRAIVWPAGETVEAAASEDGPPGEHDLENGYYHRLEQHLRAERRARAEGLSLVIKKTRKNSDILHVSASQRFWLRPVLAELENQKLIKLLAVDWNETFAPDWLPLVNRRRKEIRTAEYAIRNTRHVTTALQEYMDHGFQNYLLEIDARLGQVRHAAQRRKALALPGLEELLAMARSELKISIILN